MIDTVNIILLVSFGATFIICCLLYNCRCNKNTYIELQV